MKMIKRSFCCMVVLMMLVAMVLLLVSESEVQTVDRIDFEDGSYVIVTISEDSEIATWSLAASKTKSGTKAYNAYSSSDELLWKLSVHGTFTYDGTSAEATDADYSYSIYNSDGSFKSGSASCSGATATAKGTFKHGLTSDSASVSLTCSANGTLS